MIWWQWAIGLGEFMVMYVLTNRFVHAWRLAFYGETKHAYRIPRLIANNKETDLDTDTIKVMLSSSSYTGWAQ